MADYQFITNQGLVMPDTAEIRAGVEDAWIEAFGDSMPLDPETPQGALVTMEIENRDAVVRNNAELANQINPDIAGGIFLDAIWRLTGGDRNENVHSVINGVVFSGIPATIIPKGSEVETSEGIVFLTADTVVISESGSVTGDVVAQDPGPIYVPPNGLTVVASSVLGWETVNNPIAAIPGRDEESDVSSRRRRRQTLALQGTSVTEAITSRLYDIPSVRSLSFRENTSHETQTIDGIEMVPHSIYVCVEGGTDDEIATALFETKTAGAAYNGGTTYTITDEYSGQSYIIKWDRPSEINVFIRVTVKPSALDVQSLIPDLVMNYINGEVEGDIGFTIGSDASPFEISGAINQQEPSIFVTKAELSTNGTEWSSDTMPIAINQVARTQKSAVYVVIA